MQFFIQFFVLLILAVALCSGGNCLGKKSNSAEFEDTKTIYHSARMDSYVNVIDKNTESIYHSARIELPKKEPKENKNTELKYDEGTLEYYRRNSKRNY
uniref:Uncharacterized protein n=1 Tax=Globodera pallida TaxID=36090 RepID=A0A183C821_GLOPA